MAIRDLNDIARLRQTRAELQQRLEILESGKLAGVTFQQAIAAARHARRGIAECDGLIKQCRPLKAHKGESLHLF